MSGQPKDTQKEYSPAWGGPGRGGGRKPSPWRKQVLILACSADEVEEIQAEFTPRQRAEILLQAVNENVQKVRRADNQNQRGLGVVSSV